MDFVAIDFETANHAASSACQVAAVVVRDSQIAHEQSWLIRPPQSYFSPHNIAIHGIRPSHVAGAPTMAGVWKELEPLLEDQVIIAHNARFDMGVLIASLQARKVACPNLEFQCTRLLAKNTWPGKNGYGLKPLGNWLGIRFKHHDALEDSRCCARIALAVSEATQQRTLPQIETHLNLQRGTYRDGRLASPRGTGGRRISSGAPGLTDRLGFPQRHAANAKRLDSKLVLTASEKRSLPLAGKSLVMLGPLGGMTEEETHAFLRELGGTPQTTIQTDTDYVVACTSTIQQAKDLIDAFHQSTPGQSGNPQSPRPLSGRQFRALLPAGNATTNW